MEVKIKTIQELQVEVNILSEKLELMARERTNLTQNINKTRKSIAVLEERILNNTQYELYPE